MATVGRRGSLFRLRRAGGTPVGPDGALVAALAGALSPDRVRNDSAERSLLARDASVFKGGLSGPICFPTSTAEVQAIMRISLAYGRAVVPRGAGTGLAGGAIPLGAPVVVSTTKMNRILEVDLDDRVAWVEPGVVNLDLSNHLRPLGFHFAPDPSSQQACTIGGNVANNSGGPHCLAYGVTSHHVVALDVVLPDGDVVTLGGVDPEPGGYDLRGAFVGGEGTLGIATRIAVRITPNPPAVRTLLLAFDSIEGAATTVSDVIAAGIVPAAMEVMDRLITRAVENFVHAGYPDAAAVLLAEVDGMEAGTAIDAERIAAIGRANGAISVRVAADDEERARLWKGRKTAFGAVAQIAPSYYLHDTVVPRSALASVLRSVYAIGEAHQLTIVNVFHAGDGNLHPLILFDPLEPGVLERVHAAGAEIVAASLDAGGVLSGEHGIGVEKRDYMHLMFGPDDLDHQNRLRRAFDPMCRANPGKVIPSSHSCADIQALRSVPTGVWG
ncbi:FAD-binding protein [Acidiferrimicrobium sp. IK]|uniref:FAD-binding oxidoreductase n=1 Tax=Acidiferrimicrobium sp. IK TaxID=2871700 RepID=UPI0021CB8FA1|nr:FAD-linked oxidase C-terminal domain-containing protein [Acidiferrimicrobium sp. IK]MCU4184432.1 FAD-binding protein [Acidiferrimicrobium sp. IK]